MRRRTAGVSLKALRLMPLLLFVMPRCASWLAKKLISGVYSRLPVGISMATCRLLAGMAASIASTSPPGTAKPCSRHSSVRAAVSPSEIAVIGSISTILGPCSVRTVSMRMAGGKVSPCGKRAAASTTGCSGRGFAMAISTTWLKAFQVASDNWLSSCSSAWLISRGCSGTIHVLRGVSIVQIPSCL